MQIFFCLFFNYGFMVYLPLRSKMIECQVFLFQVYDDYFEVPNKENK